jgi:MerR family transcriptional regulator, thiopeptide resistance regulator
VVTRAAHADEARARWGHTEAFRESQRRASRYTTADWEEIKRESGAVEARIAAALREGWPPDSTIAMDLAESHRELLSRWFYDCSPELHRALGSMYVEDDRFTQHYEERAAGLASYLCDAIHANADRLGDVGV